jgi:NAD(P)H-nitrite reductase large subunit
MSKRYLIIGCGAAGWSAVQAIRTHDQDGTITMVSGETAPPYARMLLSYWLEGKVDEDVMYPFPSGYFEGLGVEVLYGQRATVLTPQRQQVTLADGRVLSYDALLLATGASPWRPPIAGLDLPGVFNLWTLEDVRGILAALQTSEEAVVIGAGFIGMQAVDALVKREVHCTIVEALPQVLPRILDADGARLVEARLAEQDVRVFTTTQVAEIRPAGKHNDVVLQDGRVLPADIVITATGVRPNLGLARAAGLETATGILVDETLRTSAPHIYAAGDVAEGYDFSTGKRAVHAIWPTAVDQGRVAGLNMAGVPATYTGSLSMNTLNVLGLPLASVGLYEGEGVEVQERRELDREVYRKLAFRNGRLTGAILVGELEDIGLLQAMIRQQTNLARWKGSLAWNPLNLGKALLAYGGGRP